MEYAYHNSSYGKKKAEQLTICDNSRYYEYELELYTIKN